MVGCGVDSTALVVHSTAVFCLVFISKTPVKQPSVSSVLSPASMALLNLTQD